MKPSFKTAERAAAELLKRMGIDKLPIPVDEIARQQRIHVEGMTLDENVSGMLIHDDGEWFIGYNSRHNENRRRFTMAHELGHFMLHKDKSAIFLDKLFWAVFRDSGSATGDSHIEVEANTFAAALLMPEHLVRREIEKARINVDDDTAMESLARTFKVSVQAMTYRLINLKLHL